MTSECFVVAGTAFCYSCAMFALSTLLLVPAVGTILEKLSAPAIIAQGAVLFILFGLPVMAAIRGIDAGARVIDPHNNSDAA